MGDFEEAVMDAIEWKAKCRKLEAELAALNITSQQLRDRVAELEADLKFTSEMLVNVSRNGMTLREELAALKAAVPEKYKMQPYQTVDKGSTNYKAGWNACINAMLTATPAKPQNTEQDP